MPASSCLLHWMAGSEVSLEVKLSLADKQAAINRRIACGFSFLNIYCARLWALIEIQVKRLLPVWTCSWIPISKLYICHSGRRDTLRCLWSVILSPAWVNNSAFVLMRHCLCYRGREVPCKRLEVSLHHIYLQGGTHPVNMPLKQEKSESGVWQSQRCSRLWSAVPSQATQSDSTVMKSEAHGRLYVIISGSLKPDREWLSWMVIVTLPPW